MVYEFNTSEKINLKNMRRIINNLSPKIIEEEQLNYLRDKIAHKEAYINSLRKLPQEIIKKIDDLELKFQEKNKEYNSLILNIENIKIEKENLSFLLSGNKKEFEYKTDEIKILENKISDLHIYIDQQKKEHSQRMEKAKFDINEEEKKMDDAHKKIEEKNNILTQSIEKQNEELKNIEINIISKNNFIEEKKKEIFILENEFKNNNDKFNELRKEMENYSNSLNEKKGLLNQMQNEENALRVIIIDLYKKIDSVKNELFANENRILDITKREERLRNNATSLRELYEKAGIAFNFDI